MDIMDFKTKKAIEEVVFVTKAVSMDFWNNLVCDNI
jgi:hypothetical protein